MTISSARAVIVIATLSARCPYHFQSTFIIARGRSLLSKTCRLSLADCFVYTADWSAAIAAETSSVFYLFACLANGATE
jgi:hypothetical protein